MCSAPKSSRPPKNEGRVIKVGSEAKLEILADLEALARRVADWLCAILTASTARGGALAVALSGGGTPRRLYEALAGPPYREVFPWHRTHLFWGDERFVAHDDESSNYRMVRDAMLSQAPIRATNIHPVRTEGGGCVLDQGRNSA
jgi:6-phosphogluconolactonase